jgi:hypothetical protein
LKEGLIQTAHEEGSEERSFPSLEIGLLHACELKNPIFPQFYPAANCGESSARLFDLLNPRKKHGWRTQRVPGRRLGFGGRIDAPKAEAVAAALL